MLTTWPGISIPLVAKGRAAWSYHTSQLHLTGVEDIRASRLRRSGQVLIKSGLYYTILPYSTSTYGDFAVMGVVKFCYSICLCSFFSCFSCFLSFPFVAFQLSSI